MHQERVAQNRDEEQDEMGQDQRNAKAAMKPEFQYVINEPKEGRNTCHDDRNKPINH